jgi:hypothetical protein
LKAGDPTKYLENVSPRSRSSSKLREAEICLGQGEALPDVCRALAVSEVIGYLTSALLGRLGLSRRGLLASAGVLVLTPLHWLLLSLAAWRGLYQLVVSPYAWEKTEHGLSKSARLAAGMTRSLL